VTASTMDPKQTFTVGKITLCQSIEW
jgi:hypothetical protein